MGFKTTTGIYWTNLELKGLLEDEDSCVHQERVQKHLGLHPYHLTDLNAALHEILSASLNSYDPELNGLVLAYKNPKLLSPLGDVLYDTCFVHVDVEADFYVFRPEVGRSLKGFVNKKGTNHIGILVHKAFNVSVPKPDNYENEGNEEETEQEEWPGDKVKVGQEVRFTPDEIDYKTRLPYMRGSLHKEEYLRGCQLFDENIAAIYKSEFQEITRRSFSENGPDIKKEILSQPKNKRITFDSDSEVDSNPKSSIVKLNSCDTQEPEKSPTKKRKRKSTSESESELNKKTLKKQKIKIEKNTPPDNVNDSEVSNNLTKKQKKRKDDKIPATSESENEDITKNSSNENGLEHKKKILIKTEKKRTLDNDSEVNSNPESGMKNKSSVEKLNSNSCNIQEPEKSPSKKRKRKSVSESDTDLSQKSHKEQKIKIEKNTPSDNEITKNPSKKRKKLKDQQISETNSEHQEIHSSSFSENGPDLKKKNLIKTEKSSNEKLNSNFDNSQETEMPLLKKPKSKSISESETESSQKSHKAKKIKIEKNTPPDNVNEVEVSKKDKKKRKKLKDQQIPASIDSEYQDINNSTFSENGSDLKKKITIKSEKPSIEKLNLNSNDSQETEIHLSKKQKIKCMSESETELSQKSYKAQKIKIEKNTPPDNGNEVEVSKKDKKKRKKHIVNNESSNSTEDEKNQKSLINRLL